MCPTTTRNRVMTIRLSPEGWFPSSIWPKNHLWCLNELSLLLCHCFPPKCNSQAPSKCSKSWLRGFFKLLSLLFPSAFVASTLFAAAILDYVKDARIEISFCYLALCSSIVQNSLRYSAAVQASVWSLFFIRLDTIVFNPIDTSSYNSFTIWKIS